MEKEEAKKFVDSLSEDEKTLILLRDELYEGSWEEMLKDLKNRLEGKPYVFKLATRIEDDIKRIEKLERFERENGINLGEFL